MVMLPLGIPLIVSEVYLRIDGDYATYSERVGYGYSSYYNQEPEHPYWNHEPNAEFVIDHGDFRFVYNTNELGLRELPGLKDEPDTNAFRIITLGDSFTEGIGAPYDSAWPRALENRLTEVLTDSGVSVQLYNAGMSGADPVYNYRMLKDKLLGFRPNLVVQCINTSDLTDFLFRGGLDRYNGARTKFKSGPWWEGVYALSYTFRMLVHTLGYDRNLVKEWESEMIFEEALWVYNDLFKNQMDSLANANDFDVLYMIQPMPDEIINGCCYYHHMTKLDSVLKESELISLDFFYPMQNRMNANPDKRFGWPTDGHYNSKGYWIMGETMADSVYGLLNSGDLRFHAP